MLFRSEDDEEVEYEEGRELVPSEDLSAPVDEVYAPVDEVPAPVDEVPAPAHEAPVLEVVAADAEPEESTES